MIGGAFLGMMTYLLGRRENGREHERERSYREELDLLKELRHIERSEELHLTQVRGLDEARNAAVDQQKYFTLRSTLTRAEIDAANAKERYWNRRLEPTHQTRRFHDQIRRVHEIVLGAEGQAHDDAGLMKTLVSAEEILTELLAETKG